jgi:Mg2+-importing ATPase
VKRRASSQESGCPEAFWAGTLESVRTALGADLTGLTGAEADRRLARFGPNVLRPRARRSIALQFLSRFSNPLVLLLLAAAVISGITRDAASAAILIAVVLLSITLDFVQEFRAGQAAERLQQSVALRTLAVRDGKPAEIEASRLVPGDVVRLAPGRLVPADGRLIAARDLYVHQALLTGEPYPVEKAPADGLAPDANANDASNALFMGSSVTGGTGDMLVCRTGGATMLGGIAGGLAKRATETAFESGVRNFGLLILRLAFLLVLFVLLVNALFHRPWLDSFLFAVALAVGLTPELLPMITSVTLSRGALRMARERVIVKRLAAVHDLGSMDVLCTDKTGTLTEAKIRLVSHVDAAGTDSPWVLDLLLANCRMATGIGSSLDDAVLACGEGRSGGWTRVDEVPFDFERRCASVLADDGRRRLLIVKGAPEDVLRHATRVEGAGASGAEPVALDDAAREAVQKHFEAFGEEGRRVLAVAWKALPRERDRCSLSDEADLVFAGFATFEDPPKKDAAEAVRALGASGVAVKVLTGDNEAVTRHVCGELGIEVTGVLAGGEVQAMSDPALLARVRDTNLFCRVTPPQKNRILQAIRRQGHVVGYLGDGINDAPSLHSADVGISVDGAADVAREAADLILLEHDLGVLQRGVLEGRRTFGNIMKYVMMGTSSNFGNMFSMALGSLLLPFLPLLPVQILVNNLLYDLSEIPIPMDTVDEADLVRPRRWDIAFVRRFMVGIGPVSSVFDFLTFGVLLLWFRAGEKLFHTGWFVESLATQVLVIFVIRTRGNPLRSRPCAALAATSLAVVVLAIALPFTPVGARIGFVPLPLSFFLFLAGAVGLYLVAVQVVKQVFYRLEAGRTKAITGGA